MATSYYSTGTISLTNGSAVVTGAGTAWQTALIEGGNIFPKAIGMPLPIASVDSNTQITAEFEWPGATGTYEYRIQRDTAYLKTLDRNSENVAYLLDEMRKGTLFKYDASGTLADRSLFDPRPKGFAYLALDGDVAELYVKRSNASGDWAGPYGYGAGPVGPAPALGIGNVTTRPAGQPATASVLGANGSYAINLGLPAGEKGNKGDKGDEGDRGPVGDTGARGITWRGAWLSGDIYSPNDIVIDDDAEGDAATWIALTESSGLRPRDNPSDWQFFPASVPATLSDGLWGEAATETSNDGVWGA
ncbi:hypothetical protein AAIH70_11775 [Neorhizobium sp. BT27B]|uniref:hypothetical protein n=1 Tax=Neorhizobium sp. BT27B TaxID=3142625 RepID=UPI003D277793